jgi:signal transduction histidine kinase
LQQNLPSDSSAIESPEIDVEVQGAPRNLNPIVRDEAYRIAGEALRNAFRHAQALRITVEIRYERRQFRLRVRDDGKGIDEATVRRGTPDTSACTACASAPKSWAGDWRFGASMIRD